MHYSSKILFWRQPHHSHSNMHILASCHQVYLSVVLPPTLTSATWSGCTVWVHKPSEDGVYARYGSYCCVHTVVPIIVYLLKLVVNAQDRERIIAIPSSNNNMDLGSHQCYQHVSVADPVMLNLILYWIDCNFWTDYNWIDYPGTFHHPLNYAHQLFHCTMTNAFQSYW